MIFAATLKVREHKIKMSHKRWEQYGNEYNLYFTPFYDEKLIATISRDGYGDLSLNCELSKSEDEYLCGDLEEAKDEVETMIEDHYRSEMEYNAELLFKFKE